LRYEPPGRRLQRELDFKIMKQGVRLLPGFVSGPGLAAAFPASTLAE